jgi:hypothetical protein
MIAQAGRPGSLNETTNPTDERPEAAPLPYGPSDQRPHLSGSPLLSFALMREWKTMMGEFAS